MPPKRSPKQSALRNLEQRDKKFIWHPFTQMQEWQSARQIIIKEGKGSTLTDIHDNKYIDGVSSLWVTV
ncbi:MAG TPA: adenosylmethionine--8-amino-7-oxononanoate transaminase, partial [Nitrospirota bacterium]|nr:adenosylmethionine--8-amino-7-oxononanoate transaminase [Nitrospirota bacterium]